MAEHEEEDLSSLTAVQGLLEKERRKMRGRFTLMSVIFLILIIGAAGGSFYVVTEKTGKSNAELENVKKLLSSEQRKADAVREESEASKEKTTATLERLERSEQLLRKIEGVMTEVGSASASSKDKNASALEAEIASLKELMKSLSGEVSSVKSDLLKVKQPAQVDKKVTPPSEPQAKASESAVQQNKRPERTFRQVMLTSGDSTASVPWMIAIP